MTPATRIGSLIASVVVLLAAGAAPGLAQTYAYQDLSSARVFGNNTLGVDVNSHLRSKRANYWGAYYYQLGDYSAKGHLIGFDINLPSGRMYAYGWQLFGTIPTGNANSEITLPNGTTYSCYDTPLTFASQTPAPWSRPLIALPGLHLSFDVWLFTVGLGILPNMAISSTITDAHYMMSNNVMTGITATMRQGIDVNCLVFANIEVNLLIIGAGASVQANVTLVGAGMLMPFTLDFSQITSDLKFTLYQAASVDVRLYAWFLFWEASYTWNVLPYTSWFLFNLPLVSIRG